CNVVSASQRTNRQRPLPRVLHRPTSQAEHSCIQRRITMPQRLGIAVIGAGMAGRAHASAWRAAPTVGSGELPDLELVSVCDIAGDLAAATASRYGFSRHDTNWQDIVDAPDIDIVSVVVANSLHKEIVEALLAAGKHVLCEKPLTDTLDDA